MSEMTVGNLEPGATKHKFGRTITMETDGTVEDGDVVAFDSEGLVTVAGVGDDVLGVAGRSQAGVDDFFPINIAALTIVARVDPATETGDYLEAAAGGEFGVADTPEGWEPRALTDAVEGKEGDGNYSIVYLR